MGDDKPPKWFHDPANAHLPTPTSAFYFGLSFALVLVILLGAAIWLIA